MSEKRTMFIPLDHQPTRQDDGWWLYDSDILTTSQMYAFIEARLDLPSHVLTLRDGVWGLMVEAMAVQL